MGISLKPEHLKRYKDIAYLLMKYGRSDLVKNAGLEVKDFVDRLPSRVNKILDSVANNEIEVKVNAIDEHLLMEGLQKVANRITLGLVLAALIVGAAMLMSVPTDFRILGYPGLAIIFFLAAASGGVLQMINILFYDEKAKKK